MIHWKGSFYWPKPKRLSYSVHIARFLSCCCSFSNNQICCSDNQARNPGCPSDNWEISLKIFTACIEICLFSSRWTQFIISFLTSKCKENLYICFFFLSGCDRFVWCWSTGRRWWRGSVCLERWPPLTSIKSWPLGCTWWGLSEKLFWNQVEV